MIEDSLAQCFAETPDVPAVLREAMIYSACGGGKRFRGALVLGACAAVGGIERDALPAACAVEMVHAFSLVHDDLPCMDDDDLRRGKPTNHKVFGEALALLAGDGLLVEGLAVMTRTKAQPGRVAASLCMLLRALGPAGMIGGQTLDLLAETDKPDLAGLQAIHRAKTGALIRAAVGIGGLLGGGSSASLAALDKYAASLGLAFQIVDDLLDLTGDLAALGKTPGSDLRKEKATYPALLGLDRARKMAREEIDRALDALKPFGDRGTFLAEMARFVGERQS